MESNTPKTILLQGDAENAIKNLQSVLNNNYLAAEKIMLLHNPEIKALNKSVAKIEDSFDYLMKLMSCNMVPLQTIGAVTINKCEFDAQVSTGTMGSCKDTTCFNTVTTYSAKYDPQYCTSSKGSTKP